MDQREITPQMVWPILRRVGCRKGIYEQIHHLYGRIEVELRLQPNEKRIQEAKAVLNAAFPGRISQRGELGHWSVFLVIDTSESKAQPQA